MPRGCAVVEAAGQLADDDHVGAFDHVILQRRRIDQRRIGAHRPQIREHVQHLAHAQQAFFGPLSGGALSNSGRPTAPISVASAQPELFGLLRQRRAGFMNGDAAEQAFGQSSVCPNFLATAFRTSTAALVTSVPIPSPGKIRILRFILIL